MTHLITESHSQPKHGVPCKPSQTSVKTNRVEHPHDDRKSPLSGPYDDLWEVTCPVRRESCFLIGRGL